ncbi:response regulator transcription factor [Arthrobacter sp. FW305-BF8]|uniref:response regulator transcription factor n=1 Tax=Arthrobacter sp. FW305-BF8 TaxID=2879617 RepID=UPI001F2E154C|nr:response regulator transcription factor [Arthrobacter sp. FW305-BF8]UKA53175.1 response regulator transcription factor [Arthrobacter sp. FW305-BF8]
MNDRRVVVVIDRDEEVRSLLRTTLGEAGFVVHCAATGEAGLALVRAKQPDTVTLDLVLPDMDGYEVLRRIREFSHTYILIITARSGLGATLKGFDAGADDYMVKPIRPRELRARVDGMLRRPRQLTVPPIVTPRQAPLVSPRLRASARAEIAPGPAPAHGLPVARGLGVALDVPAAQGLPAAQAFEHNGLAINSATRAATLGGRALQLTRTEFDLLYILLQRGSGVVSKAELVGLLGLAKREAGTMGGSDAGVRDAGRIIETHVGNLRRKLGDDARQPRWLKTVRGAGYTLA